MSMGAATPVVAAGAAGPAAAVVAPSAAPLSGGTTAAAPAVTTTAAAAVTTAAPAATTATATAAPATTMQPQPATVVVAAPAAATKAAAPGVVAVAAVPPSMVNATIASALTRAGLTMCLKLLEAAGAGRRANNPRTFATVFCPTNAAIDKFLAEMGLTADELAARPELVDRLAAYHIAPRVALRLAALVPPPAGAAAAAAAAAKGGPGAPGAPGAPPPPPRAHAYVVSGDPAYLLRFVAEPPAPPGAGGGPGRGRGRPGAAVRDAQGNIARIVGPDILAGRSVVHAVDRVLLSGEYFPDLAAFARFYATNFTGLALALAAAGDASLSKSKRWAGTMFAPTDAALDAAEQAGYLPSGERAWRYTAAYLQLPTARRYPWGFGDGAPLATRLRGHNISVSVRQLQVSTAADRVGARKGASGPAAAAPTTTTVVEGTVVPERGSASRPALIGLPNIYVGRGIVHGVDGLLLPVTLVTGSARKLPAGPDATTVAGLRRRLAAADRGPDARAPDPRPADVRRPDDDMRRPPDDMRRPPDDMRRPPDADPYRGYGRVDDGSRYGEGGGGRPFAPRMPLDQFGRPDGGVGPQLPPQQPPMAPQTQQPPMRPDANSFIGGAGGVQGAGALPMTNPAAAMGGGNGATPGTGLDGRTATDPSKGLLPGGSPSPPKPDRSPSPLQRLDRQALKDEGLAAQALTGAEADLAAADSAPAPAPAPAPAAPAPVGGDYGGGGGGSMGGDYQAQPQQPQQQVPEYEPPPPPPPPIYVPVPTPVPAAPPSNDYEEPPPPPPLPQGAYYPPSSQGQQQQGGYYNSPPSSQQGYYPPASPSPYGYGSSSASTPGGPACLNCVNSYQPMPPTAGQLPANGIPASQVPSAGAPLDPGSAAAGYGAASTAGQAPLPPAAAALPTAYPYAQPAAAALPLYAPAAAAQPVYPQAAAAQPAAYPYAQPAAAAAPLYPQQPYPQAQPLPAGPPAPPAAVDAVLGDLGAAVPPAGAAAAPLPPGAVAGRR